MGRIHAIIWMLIGLVLMTLIVGNISSIMSMDFVFRPISIEAKEKVIYRCFSYILEVFLRMHVSIQLLLQTKIHS